MNVLDKLKRRPTPNPQKSFQVFAHTIEFTSEGEGDTKNEEEQEEKGEPVEIRNKVKIIDARKYSNVNRAEILQRLKNANMSVIERVEIKSKMPEPFIEDIVPEKEVEEVEEGEMKTMHRMLTGWLR